MAGAKKGLGRGLSALIPDGDMEFLSRIARDTAPVDVRPIEAAVENEAFPAGTAKRGGRSRTSRAEGNPSDVPHSTAGSDRGAAREMVAPAMVTTPIAASKPDPSDAPNLDEAVGDEIADDEDASVGEATTSVQWILMARVEPNPYQPRRTFSRDEMNDLVASIRNHGVLQPILVRPLPLSGDANGDGVERFQLIAGERRWRAAQEAGLSRIPAICRPVNNRQALELAVIENVQRHDISAIDAALAYRRLADEFALSQESIARRVGKSRSSIANTLRLLDLPDEVKKSIEDGVLSEGHGRAILLTSGEGARRAVFRRILRDKLSVREAERVAQIALATSLESEPKTSEANDGHVEHGQAAARLESKQRAHENDLEQMTLKLQKALGARLRLAPRGHGGRIIIDYTSPEELERLAQVLCR